MEQFTQESAYYTSTPEGDIELLDPLTGEVMKPGVIPESLLQDAELRAGYDFLRDNAEHIHLDLLLSSHDTKEDLKRAGIDLHAEAAELATQDGILFLEGVDTTASRASLTTFLNIVSERPAGQTASVRADISATGQLLPFLEETTNQIAGTGVKIARPDYAVDSESMADRTLTSWNTELTSIVNSLEAQVGDSQENLQRWYRTNVGFTVYRDWYLIGKIGNHFSKQAETGISESQEEALEYVGKLLVGSNHKNIGQLLEGFGVDVGYVGTPEAAYKEQTDRLVHAVGNVSLSNKDNLHGAL